MSDITKYLRRAIDERHKGGMQTGMPKITMREAGAARLLMEIEQAAKRLSELEQRERELMSYYKEKKERERELSTHIERLRSAVFPFISLLPEVVDWFDDMPHQSLQLLTEQEREKAVKYGFLEAVKLSTKPNLEPLGIDVYAQKAAQQYAKRNSSDQQK